MFFGRLGLLGLSVFNINLWQICHRTICYYCLTVICKPC
jgi:hypothetical protein